ncbi:MAG: hypothetical protein QM754_21170 [Tepidisphaeraceae bacterium]
MSQRSHAQSGKRPIVIRSAVSAVESLEHRRLMALVAAKPAEEFVDSVGVNTHFTIGDTNNPYAKQLLLDLVKAPRRSPYSQRRPHQHGTRPLERPVRRRGRPHAHRPAGRHRGRVADLPRAPA